MGESCIITPTIQVNGQEKESKLFNELASFTGNREQTEELWALAQSKEIQKALNLKLDENGEVTFDSLNKAVDIKKYTNGQLSYLGEKVEAKASNMNGDPIKYSDSQEAINNATEYNKTSQKYVATVGKDGKTYVIKVDPKTVENSDAGARMIFHNTLNQRLQGILRGIGFDVTVDETMQEAGVFDPLNSEPTENGLRTIIRIAKGQIGEDAFPEEFAHVMIAGLHNNGLVQRLMNVLTPEVVEEVLGDSYQAYYNAYDGNTERLKKEAAGKLLAQQIKENKTNEVSKNLISRIWNYIKQLFSNTSEDSINEAITIANSEAGKLADYVINNDIKDEIDDYAIINQERLYSLGTEIFNMESLANRSVELLSKRMKLLLARSKDSTYSEKDIKDLNRIKDLIEKKEYVESTTEFLNTVLQQINTLNETLSRRKTLDPRSETSITKIRSISNILRQIKEFSEAYIPIIEDIMSLPAALERGDVNISEKDAEDLSKQANEINRIIKNISSNYKKMRFDTVFNFLKLYWGEDKIIEFGKDKGTSITLKMILEMADKDINGLDRWISSLGDTSSPILSLMYKVIKTTHAKRDDEINTLNREILAAHKKLTDAGYTSDFMYERDSKGNLTGRIISHVDFAKFNEERNAYQKSLEEEGYTKARIKSKVESWERRRTIKYIVPGTDPEITRTEMIPDPAQYPSNSLDRLSPAQKEYYDFMMVAKARMDSLLPDRQVSFFNAIQISKDMTEAILTGDSSIKQKINVIKDRLKSSFIQQVDDTEYGDRGNILLDFTGKPINRIPVYYTTPLKDPSLLSTDFTGSMMSYTGMAINYNEMNKIIDVLELARDTIKDIEIQQTAGNSKLHEAYTVLKSKYIKKYTKKGKQLNIGSRLDDFYESVIYQKHKKNQGTIGDTNVSTDKTLDTIKSFTGVLGLGVNVFGAISNVAVGSLQMWIDANSREFFGPKNFINGKKNYWKDLPSYMAEINSAEKKSKMSLLIDKFDVLDDFYSENLRNKIYKNAYQRIIGNSNIFFLNSMGEHYLRTNTLLAMMDRYKVKKNGKEITLYEAMTVKQIDGRYEIVLDEGVTKTDGSALTNDDLMNFKLKVNRVNQTMNGAFNEDDKGTIHRNVLGRLAMQFRQWMPAHYYRRFAKPYYDSILDEYREGYYQTLGRFLLDTMKDLRRAKFHLATNYKNLKSFEKANIRRALTELGAFIILGILSSMVGDDADETFGTKMLSYQLQRMKLEVGASIPSPTALDNLWSILQSPAAAIQSFNNLGDLLCFWNIFNEIESGRYKGWSEYERDLIQLIPMYGQIQKVIDLPTEDYMFTIFNKTD